MDINIFQKNSNIVAATNKIESVWERIADQVNA